MKKIIFVTNFLGNGGAARVMTTIAMYLANKNYNVEILSFLDGKDIYKLNDKVNYRVIKCTSKNKLISKIERILKLRKIINQNKEATVISFEYFVNMQTIISCLFLKNKLIISERNDPARVGNNKKHLRNFLYRFADVLVCQTNEAMNYFPKFIKKKSVIILNPIKDNLPKRWLGKRNKQIVNFCRLEVQKNLPLLVDAFEIVHKKFQDYKLIIYGDGKEKDNLLKYINKKSMNDLIILNPPVENIHEKILKSAMFVSSSDYEGLSNSMLEAMAIGLPTICTDCPCGGAGMIIKNEYNGLLVPIKDVKKLSESMIKLIENSELSEKISKNATDLKFELSKEKICKEWESLF